MGEHDLLFKRAFRIPKHAAGELAAVLPKQVLDAIDLDSLALVEGDDMVDRWLDERFKDALFRASFRGGVTGYIWFLVEHQSEPDHFMALRVLKYLVRSWMELIRIEPQKANATSGCVRYRPPWRVRLERSHQTSRAGRGCCQAPGAAAARARLPDPGRRLGPAARR